MQASHSGNDKRTRKPRRSLARLFRDNAGNTMAIVGAALIPITAMIGSGLDMSRAYMAKSRLQSACDAASLAARRVMKNDDLSDNVTQTGEDFFNFNFPQGLYETEEFEPNITKPETGLIRIDAETRIPTTVMKLFGFSTLPLEVNCEASLNFVNTDVVLVLDVTGSMQESVDDVRKMDALQEAVLALYDELSPVQAQLTAQGLRLRYGVVPYSSTVNVGRLLTAVDEDYIRSSTPYQSRVANYTKPYYAENTPTSAPGSWEINNKSRTAAQCRSWVTASATNGGGPAPASTTRTSYRGSEEVSGYNASTNWGWPGASDTSGNELSCRRWRIVTTTTYTTRYIFKDWTYREATLDTSEFKRAGGTINLATDNTGSVPVSATYNLQELAENVSGVNTTSQTWNGCIEERNTDSTITTASGYGIPSTAFDLNINDVPDSDATRWRPMLPKAIYTRARGSLPRDTGIALNPDNAAFWPCPHEARRLQEWDRDDLEDYVEALEPLGGTYHDIGMIWGARLISTGGVFGDACETFNGMPCNRHVIFMTDGQQTAYCENTYTAYGLESNDMRVTGDGTCPDQLARHEQRFKMICNATKNMGVSVWVVAFDTTLNANLTSCADNASQAFVSEDQEDLIQKFREIGNQIGALRLTK